MLKRNKHPLLRYKAQTQEYDSGLYLINPEKDVEINDIENESNDDDCSYLFDYHLLQHDQNDVIHITQTQINIYKGIACILFVFLVCLLYYCEKSFQ